MLAAAKYIGAGLATIGLAGAGVNSKFTLINRKYTISSKPDVDNYNNNF